jgi:glycosyltransferase involved in cell wall biosynthesis
MPIQVITDARVIQDFYRNEWNRETRCFAYGAEIYPRGFKSQRLVDMDLEEDGYILYVSRMERENNALLVVQAYREVETDLPLVMVGDAPYAQDYVNAVKRAADSRVRFLGFRFGDDYHALQANARIYVQATEVGGTHPALVEALAHGNAVLAHDVPEHREVLGDAGGYFAYRDSRRLAQEMELLLNDNQRLCGYRDAAVERAERHYGWKAVTDQYEAYFKELLEAKRR